MNNPLKMNNQTYLISEFNDSSFQKTNNFKNTNKIKLNHTNKIERANNIIHNNTMNAKSIRLKIDLPSSNSTLIKKAPNNSQQMVYLNHNQFQKENDSIDDFDENEEEFDNISSNINTICLQISFEQNNLKRNKKRTSKHQSIKIKNNLTATTSGYSSSSVDSTKENISFDYDFNKNRHHKQYQNQEKTPITIKPNIYDKLNYVGRSSTSRRLSLCSSTSTSSLASSISSISSSTGSNNSCSKWSNDQEPNLYEEISNFYENNIIDDVISLSKPINESNNRQTNNKSMVYDKLDDFASLTSSTSMQKYKKEYTVNDIFQNLKTIEQHTAIQCKEKQDDLFKIPSAPTINFSLSDQHLIKTKQVQKLKQIFETNANVKHTSIVSSSFFNNVKTINQSKQLNNITDGHSVLKQNNIKINKPDNHVYVNERIKK